MNYYVSEGRVEELQSLLSRRVIHDTTREQQTGGDAATQVNLTPAVPSLPYTQQNQEPDYDNLNLNGGQK